jgi:hypothetical protein
MRQKKSDLDAEMQHQQALRHIRDLGLASPDAYQKWCSDHGFSDKLIKPSKQRREELRFAQDVAVRKQIVRVKRAKRGLGDVVADICAGKARAEDIAQPELKLLRDAVSGNHQRYGEPAVKHQALTTLLRHLLRCHTKLIDATQAIPALGHAAGNTYIEALVMIAVHHQSWQRDVESWRPRSHNSRRQFASLVRHLFAHYDMPSFFDSAWFVGRSTTATEFRRWYLRVAYGQSIRNCDLPIEYTKKMAHHFMHAPDDVTIPQAIRWGQVIALGGDEPLARAIFGTRLGDHFEEDDFWITVIRWFVANPMLDRAHVGPIIDYLHDQKFVDRREFVGGEEVYVAPQPNLQMKGRSPLALLQQVEAWHRQLTRQSNQRSVNWHRSGFGDGMFEEGSLEGQNYKVWTIRELLSSKELLAEGKQMKHCVATYTTSCARGECSIWTLEVESFTGTEKLLTIEVKNNYRLIWQVRGRYNRLATEKERQVVQRWASGRRLSFASHV